MFRVAVPAAMIAVCGALLSGPMTPLDWCVLAAPCVGTPLALLWAWRQDSARSRGRHRAWPRGGRWRAAAMPVEPNDE